MGVRTRLFLISVGVILAVGLVSVAFTEMQLRAWLGQDMQDELDRHADLAARTVELADPVDLDHLADELANTIDTRVAIESLDGVRLGDSALGPDELAGAAPLPEPGRVAEVRDGSLEHASARLDDAYVAVARFRRDGRPVGIVWLSRPTVAIDQALGRLQFILALAGLLGLGVAVFMSGIASHLFARTLDSIVSGARDLVRGRRPVGELEPEGRGDELTRLRGSLNRIRDDFQSLVASLASETARFEAVLEGTDEAVLALTPDRLVTVVNTAARELFGLPDDSVGRPLIELMRLPPLYDALDTVLGGEPTTCELTLPTTPPRHLMARVTPMRDQAGIVVVAHEVTRLRRLERMRRDFVTNVSHELRTPVNVIRVNAETLCDGALEDTVHAPRFVEAILRNAIRMGRLIDDLLDISRLESGAWLPTPEEVEVAELVDDVRLSVESLAARQGVTLVAGADEVEPDLWVYADPMALEHVLVNLVDNAIKYVQPGGQVTIRAYSMTDDGDGDDACRTTTTRFEIRDNGPGVEPRHRERLFERFYRIDEGRARHQGGTGLGLSIVKHLVRGMGGHVFYEPNVPRGSVFVVELPGAEPAEDGTPDAPAADG